MQCGACGRTLEQSMQRALKTNLASMDAGGRGLEPWVVTLTAVKTSDASRRCPRRAGDVTERRALT